MMNKVLSIAFLMMLLSGCSVFRTHKLDIEQGNIITDAQVSRLHRGMSESSVREVMGNPILNQVYSGNRLTYVYTMQKGYGNFSEKRVICQFENGSLQNVSVTN